MSISLWTTLLAIFLSLSHVGISAFFAWKNFPWLTGDSHRYIQLANSLISGDGFGAWTANGFEPEIMRSVGYPLFVSAGLLISGPKLSGVILLQCVLYLLAVLLVWRVGTKTFDPIVGYCYLAILAVYPFISFSVFQVSPEIPSLFLISFAAFMLLDARYWRLILATVSLCLAAQFRPNLVLLFCVPVVAILMLRRSVLTRISAVLVGATITFLPFAIYNYSNTGKLSPIPTAGGLGHSLMLTSWMSKVPIESLIAYGMTGKVDAKVGESGMIEQIAAINRKVGVSEETIFVTVESYPDNRTRIAANELLMEGAVHNIQDDFSGYAKVVISNSVRMWFSSHFPNEIPWWVRLGLLLQGITIFMIACVGVVVALLTVFPNRELPILFMVGSLLYCVVTLSFLHTEARYTIPVRLFLLLFASYGCVQVMRLIRRQVPQIAA